MVIFTFKLVDSGHIKQIVFTEAWQRILLQYRLQFPGELDCDSNISAISSIEVLHGSHIGWQDNENYLH